ncbi:MAG: MFS transporter [Candidatus Micrarchaeota archaeon]|nr:MFS transporter [Candidatus Micrarchaeota archaeon]MDE1846687.1 MFS transporter [Candidatus Micrarchaeota archaeon]
MAPRWMSRDVLLISFSAFFADLGYQAVQAIFPIYLVLTLSANPSYLGFANGIAFGGGALFAYLAGFLGVRHSRKWLAVFGSAFILLMPLVGAAVNPLLAIALFASGWWARNFRVPPRRAMLADAVRKEDLGKTFGFLHALDIGGGALAVLALLAMVYLKFSQNKMLLFAAVPLAVSVALLLVTRDIRRKERSKPATRIASGKIVIEKSAFKGIMAATALYGFSYYSLGFPILTIAEGSKSVALGILSYGIYLGVSAFTGYFIGSRKGINKIKALGYLGYILSGAGTAMLAIGYLLGNVLWAFYLGVSLMGFGLGVIETLEPSIISLLRGAAKLDIGMGTLQGARSIGLFSANVIMGILYVLSPSDSYFYAAAVSMLAGIIVLSYGRDFRE